MTVRDLKCLRCGTPMKFREQTHLELNDSGFWDIESHLKVEIYACPGCGKLEFFRSGIGVPKETAGGGAAESDSHDPSGFYTPGVAEDIKCYQCGKMHPADDPYCPLCGMPTLKPQKCKWCGEQLAAGQSICPRCGARQTES